MSDSLDRATSAIGELSGSVRALHAEVVQAEALRTAKIRWIQRVLYVLVPCVVLLVVLAISNFVLLARINGIAGDVRSTNTTLLDCINSTGECGRRNASNQGKVLDEVKRYELTVIYCARTNPQPVDPDGSAFVACINRLYPGGPVLRGR